MPITPVMSRSFGLPMLLISLAVGGFLFVSQSKTSGPTSAAVTQAETQAVAAASSTSFQAAETKMLAWFADHATYAGATLDPADGATVVRADAHSYCLQATFGTTVEHDNGPGGQAQPGPC